MTPQEAEQAFAERQTVAKSRPGWPRQPYVGFLAFKFKDGRYRFAGRSGGEVFQGIVKPNDIFVVEHSVVRLPR